MSTEAEKRADNRARSDEELEGLRVKRSSAVPSEPTRLIEEEQAVREVEHRRKYGDPADHH